MMNEDNESRDAAAPMGTASTGDTASGAPDGRPADDAMTPPASPATTATTAGAATASDPAPEGFGDDSDRPHGSETQAYAMPLTPGGDDEMPEPLFPDAPGAHDAAEADAADADGRTAPNVLNSPFPLPDLRDNADAQEDADPSRDEFTTVYDIIDRLEARLEEAKGLLLSPGMVKVDREAFADDLDELKKMLPVQLERASALMREAERRLENAQTQSNAIVASAQSRAADLVKEANEQARFLAGQENVTALARQKARRILDDAQTKADRLTQGADDYSTKVMETLRAQLTKMGGDVDAGLNVLYERRKTAARQMPHLTDDDYPEAQ